MPRRSSVQEWQTWQTNHVRVNSVPTFPQALQWCLLKVTVNSAVHSIHMDTRASGTHTGARVPNAKSFESMSISTCNINKYFDFSCMATIKVCIMYDQIVKGTIIIKTEKVDKCALVTYLTGVSIQSSRINKLENCYICHLQSVKNQLKVVLKIPTLCFHIVTTNQAISVNLKMLVLSQFYRLCPRNILLTKIVI